MDKNTSPKDLMEEIIRMLQENPRAIQLVYAYLIGFTEIRKNKDLIAN